MEEEAGIGIPAHVRVLSGAGSIAAIVGIVALSEPEDWGRLVALLPEMLRTTTLPWSLVIGGLTLSLGTPLAWFVNDRMKV